MRRRTAFVTAALAIGGIVALGRGLVGPNPVHSQSPSSKSAGRSLQAEAVMPAWPWSPSGMTSLQSGFRPIAYSTVTIKDATLPQGQTLLLTPGVQGTVYQTGPKHVTVVPPRPAKVAQGTAVVHTLVVHGVRYQYDRVLSMMTTAYNASMGMNGPWGGVAAWNGKPLQYGDVAVDPHVIPLGTYLYIDGYGPARAVDTGSAVWGDHIDLFFNESWWQVARYGIQHHKVYILTGPPSPSKG